MNAQVQHKDGELMPPEPPPSTIVEYTATEAGLADLRTRLKNVVFDVRTTAGDKAARAARKELVTLRTSLDTRRLELNSGDLERIRKRNAEATRIATEIKALEEPLDEQIKAEEKRKAEEKKAKDETERVRVADIHNRIEHDIRDCAHAAIGRTARDITIFIADMEVMVIDEAGFAEFKQQAEGARATTLIRLKSALASAQKMEAEQARLKAEAEENERVRLANEAAAQAERERLAEEERVAKVARDAEAARVAAENERIRVANEEAAKAERARLAESVRLAKEELERERLRQQAEADIERARLAEVERAERETRETEAAAERQRIANADAALQRRRDAQVAEAQRLADERAAFEAQQLTAKVSEVKAVEAPESNVLQFTAPLPATDELPEVKVTVGGESIPSTPEQADPPAEELTANLNLKVYLIMESVCKAAQAWAVFQSHDSRLDQKKDRKLAAAAKTAELNLLAMVEQLP